jgi:predicted Zn-dependent protease
VAAGKPDFAAKAVDEGLRHCPEDDRLLVAASRVYLAQDETGKARRALELAAKENSANADAWRGLAWIAAKEGDEAGMTHALAQAVEVDRDATLAWIAKESTTLPELNAFGKQQ